MRFTPAMLALGWWLTSAQAQEPAQEQGPDLDFLEYLGAWAEEDDEWLAIEEWEKDNGAEPQEDPEEDPEGSDRQEDDDDESD
jgi:hypothetical protein